MEILIEKKPIGRLGGGRRGERNNLALLRVHLVSCQLLHIHYVMLSPALGLFNLPFRYITDCHKISIGHADVPYIQ